MYTPFISLFSNGDRISFKDYTGAGFELKPSFPGSEETNYAAIIVPIVATLIIVPVLVLTANQGLNSFF